jgi:hypothetical protein
MFSNDTHISCYSAALSTHVWYSKIRNQHAADRSNDSAFSRGHIPHTEFHTHTPLDQIQPSIRTLRVLPDLSPEGLLQCDLANTHINNDFTYLSYTWGEEGTACFMLVNS